MKKNWIVMFLILSAYATTAFGDSASPGRTVTTNVMVTNLDQYPDIVLLAYAVYPPMPPGGGGMGGMGDMY